MTSISPAAAVANANNQNVTTKANENKSPASEGPAVNNGNNEAQVRASIKTIQVA